MPKNKIEKYYRELDGLRQKALYNYITRLKENPDKFIDNIDDYLEDEDINRHLEIEKKIDELEE